MTTIKALGVVDYHTFPREHFEINGNVLVFEAENGTGKTAIMTALFPTIFTMDFLTALNQGGQQNRKPKDFLKDTGTYIYGMFNSDEEPYTLVIHGQRRGDSVDIKATKIDTHDVTFTDDLDQPLPWNTFKNKHKEFMNTKIFHTQKEYQTWVAKEIFGIAPNRFKAYIRLLCQLSNPKIMTSENTNIEQIKEQLKNGLATISDNDDLLDILTNYATQLQKATIEKQKLIELKSQFNSALDRRKELNQHLRNTFGDTDLTRINIIPNDETLFAVWSKGVTLNEGFVGLTLTDIERVPLRPLKAVWVFENRNTAQRILRLHPELTFPFIIASGQPNKTVLALLDRLHKQRTKILYHGDMDPAGLTIASHILNHVPITTPFMSVSEYNKQKKYPQLTSQPTDIDPTFRPLLTLIQKNKQCVYEEQLDLNKCQIYYDLMV